MTLDLADFKIPSDEMTTALSCLRTCHQPHRKPAGRRNRLCKRDTFRNCHRTLSYVVGHDSCTSSRPCDADISFTHLTASVWRFILSSLLYQTVPGQLVVDA